MIIFFRFEFQSFNCQNNKFGVRAANYLLIRFHLFLAAVMFLCKKTTHKGSLHVDSFILVVFAFVKNMLNLCKNNEKEKQLLVYFSCF